MCEIKWCVTTFFICAWKVCEYVYVLTKKDKYMLKGCCMTPFVGSGTLKNPGVIVHPAFYHPNNDMCSLSEYFSTHNLRITCIHKHFSIARDMSLSGYALMMMIILGNLWMTSRCFPNVWSFKELRKCFQGGLRSYAIDCWSLVLMPKLAGQPVRAHSCS